MTNIYYETYKKAYENNELYELFSKNKKYIYDDEGKLLLSPDIKLFPDEDLIVNYSSLIMSGAVYYYYELDGKEKEEYKNRFCDAVIKMAKSNSIQELYDATQIYYVLIEQEEDDDYFPLIGYSCLFRDILREKVNDSIEELKNYIIGPINCRIDGYERIVEKDKKIMNVEKYCLIRGQ